jgi:hypothetical protein
MSTPKFVVATLLAAFAIAASAQMPGGGLSAEEKEKRCQADPAKCEQMKEHNRMREAMHTECEKKPDACKERRAKAQERREDARPALSPPGY